MHSALFIVELLFRIFDDPILASQPVGPTEQEHYLRRHPLLSLALSCKAFSPVALHILWRNIDGIDQLLWTMSDDIIKITLPFGAEKRDSSSSTSFVSRYSDGPRKCMTFKKQPVEQDWEPFDRYGALVIGLNGRRGVSGDPMELSSNVLEALNAHYDLKGAPLLPNLQSLTCLAQQLRYGHTLLGPQLQSLSLHNTLYDNLSYDLRAFLQLARFNPPKRLNFLELYGVGNQKGEEEVGDLFSQFVINIQQQGDGLHRVCTYFLSRFSLEALNLVLANERARELHVGVEQFDLDRVLPPGTSGTRKDLHTVMIRAEKGVIGDSLLRQSFFHEFFRRLNARNLVRFAFLGGPRYLSVHDAKAIFTFLHYEKAFTEANANESSPGIRISSAEPLDDITIDSTDYICTFANSFYLACQPMSSTDFTPRFAYLQGLELNILVDFTDSDIGSLSSSMPRLTQFNVETSRAGRTGRSRTTLISIWLLAKNCQAIESVGIWFNAVLDWERFAIITRLNVNDEDEEREALRKATNSNLSSLTIGGSNIEDTDVAIEFFQNVCPCLECLDEIGEEDWGKWEIVRVYSTRESDELSSSFVSTLYGPSDLPDGDRD